MEPQFKRNIAFKYRISDLQMGKPVFDNERFSFLELGNSKIVRVNIAGNIVDRYESPSESRYVFFTLDDGSGQIKLKAFGEDAQKFAGVIQGQTVIVIGTLRNFNNETYISPEIIKEQDPKYLMLRKLEIERNAPKIATPIEKKEIVAIRDKILDKIKAGEEKGGIEVESIINELKEASPEIINQEIKKMLEEGIIFEPRPGKIRYLG